MSILDKVNHRPESRMRETRLSGSEGGGAELNRLSLPLFEFVPFGVERRAIKPTAFRDSSAVVFLYGSGESD